MITRNDLGRKDIELLNPGQVAIEEDTLVVPYRPHEIVTIVVD